MHEKINMINFDIILKGGELVLPNKKIDKLDVGISNCLIKEIGDLSKMSADKIIDIYWFNRHAWCYRYSGSFQRARPYS